MGESFGLYKLANDEEIMPYVTSANVAGGFHAGDPHVMRATVKAAKKNDVEVGIHPGLPDRIGFGRRFMKVTRQELTDYIVYQAGALQAFLKPNQMQLQHVFTHGIMATMCWETEEYSYALIDAVNELGKDEVILAGAKGGPGDRYILHDIAEKAGLRVGTCFILDMDYEPDGSLYVTRTHAPVDIEQRVQRAVNMIKNGRVKDVKGGEHDYKATTMIVHSDTPNVIQLLQALHEELPREGIEILPLKEIV